MQKKKTYNNKKGETKVIIEMPDEVEINLVQSNEVKHYELFQWLVTLLLPIAVGFWTAYCTGNKSIELFLSALVFTTTSLLFAFLAYRCRKKLFHGTIKRVAYFNSFEKE